MTKDQKAAVIPAFPHFFPSDGAHAPEYCAGMELLDYYAGLAMQAYASQHETCADYIIARDAYKLGEAMLLERERRQKGQP